LTGNPFENLRSVVQNSSLFTVCRQCGRRLVAISVVGDFMAPLEDRTNYVFMSLCYPAWDKKGGLDIESVQ